MNYNRKRHKLLRKLSVMYSKRNLEISNRASSVGLTFEQIDNFLKVNAEKRDLILSELWISKEITLFQLGQDGDGCFISDIGISSVSMNKYRNKDLYFLFKYLKIASGIVIFLISIFTFYYTFIEKKLTIPYIKQKTQKTIKDTLTQAENIEKNNPNFQIHKTE